MMSRINRRRALAIGAVGCATLLAGCWDTEVAAVDPQLPTASSDSTAAPAPGTSPSTTPSTNAVVAWNVGSLYFIEGGLATIDLTATLPNGIVKGGNFGVSADGAALPTGMTLSQAGILAIGSAAPGPVVGVIFAYTEPTA